jgi:aminoglycoside phosphotransferase (APT) family kinase protein
MSDDLAVGLSDAVTQLTGRPSSITLEGEASVGATRRTLFARLHHGPESEPVVVQLGGAQLEGLASTVEAEVVRRAAAAGVPVAEPLVATDDSRWVGRPFQVVRRVEGETIPRRILRAAAADPALGRRLTQQLGDALARLHGSGTGSLPEGVPALVDPTPAAAYRARLADIAAMSPPSPVVALGRRWLARHEPPPPDRVAIVHADLRNGNLIVDIVPSSHAYGLAAAIDWELGHVGDPMEDLAWLCLRTWRFGEDGCEVGGFGRLVDLVTAYEAAGGSFRPEAFAWWTVARTLWWCLVLTLQGQAFVHGLSDSLVLAGSGRRVAELEYDLLTLIDPAAESADEGSP